MFAVALNQAALLDRMYGSKFPIQVFLVPGDPDDDNVEWIQQEFTWYARPRSTFRDLLRFVECRLSAAGYADFTRGEIVVGEEFGQHGADLNADGDFLRKYGSVMVFNAIAQWPGFPTTGQLRARWPLMTLTYSVSAVPN
eukprot:689639-Rhodomonas_salina.1